MDSEHIGNIKQGQALIHEFNFDKLCIRKKWLYVGKEFIKGQIHHHFVFKSIWMS